MLGRYNLAQLFLFKAKTQIINIVMPNLFYDLFVKVFKFRVRGPYLSFGTL